MSPERHELREPGGRTPGLPPDGWGHPAGSDRQPSPAARRVAQQRPPPAERYSLTIGRALGTVVVTVRGLLDRTSGPVLDRLLVDLIDGQGNRTVAVDLRTATVEGVEGIRPLLAAARRTSRRGTRLILNGPSPIVCRELVKDGFAGVVELRMP